MSSPVSTITSNVNLLLLDTYNIVNSNQPYVAYVSSVTAPGKIATVRDSTGNLGTNFFKIRVSTTKDVSFTDGTNFFDITQPFGYVTMSSRDKNTWNILNAYAFPDPYGISYVSTVNVRDRLTTPNIFASSFVSTLHVNTSSLNVYKISTNTIDASIINIDNFTVNNQLTVNNNIYAFGLRASGGFFSNSMNTYNLKISYNLTNTQLQNKNATLYIGNTMDMSFNDIRTINNLYTSTINVSSINNEDATMFGGVNWSLYKAINTVDICGQEINNIQQTNKRKSGATNFGLAVSYNEINALSDYFEVYPNAFRQVLLDQVGFVYRNINPNPFTKYLVSFQFTSSNYLNSNFGTLWIYAGLSNSNTSINHFGITYNSNTPYQISANLFSGNKITTFNYQDIIDFSTWNDGHVIYPVLYATNNTSLGTDGKFVDYTLSYTLQPIFNSLS